MACNVLYNTTSLSLPGLDPFTKTEAIDTNLAETYILPLR
jgi:hypothetical protein